MHRHFTHEEELRTAAIGALLASGVDLTALWPEYPLVHRKDERVDLLVDFGAQAGIVCEFKYERASAGTYDASAAAGPIARDIMRLASVNEAQGRDCLFVLLMHEPAYQAIRRATPGPARLVQLEKGRRIPFDGSTIRPNDGITYIKDLGGHLSTADVSCLLASSVGGAHHLHVFDVQHRKATVTLQADTGAAG